jgi:hypothetical protein
MVFLNKNTGIFFFCNYKKNEYPDFLINLKNKNGLNFVI